MLQADITDQILRSYYNVYNRLGYGFLEKVYENALMIELHKQGLSCERQKSITVYYDGIKVGEYFADIIVDNQVIIEIKAAEMLVENFEIQLMNYLKATSIEVGLLLNFGKGPQFKRKVLSNERKKHGSHQVS